MSSTVHKYYIGLSFILGLFFSACSGSLDRESYIAWVQNYDNGLRAKQQSAGYFFDAQYLPEVYRQLQAGQEPTVQEDTASTDGLQHYKLTIGFEERGKDFIKGTGNIKSEQEQRLYYFSYRFQNDIYLEVGKDRLPAMLYHFERAGDLRSERNFVLGFAQKPDNKEVALVIESPFFGAQPIKINISKDHIPTLSL